MKKSAPALSGLALLALPALVAAAPAPAHAGEAAPTAAGTIQGTVSAGDEARPVADAEVVATCACLEGERRVQTDAVGAFAIVGLPPGRYTLTVRGGGDPWEGSAQVDAGQVAVTAIALHDDDDDDDDGRRHHHHHERVQDVWGGLTIGLAFAPDRPQGSLSPGASRVLVNQMSPWTGPVRGIDLRWQTYSTRRGRFPRSVGYFRSGFYKSHGEFGPTGGAFVDGQPLDLSVVTVPLFFGGNLYIFRNFPVRPYAGMGFGFDIMRLRYGLEGGGEYVDTSARIGFELHAGLEVRLTNYVAFGAEVMQLWSARRRLSNLPDVSNETFAVLIGVTGAFPVRR